MGYIMDGTEKNIGGIYSVFHFSVATDEEHDVDASFFVMDVILPRVALGGRLILALPMEEGRGDGVIFVHGGWREFLLIFVDVGKEDIRPAIA